MDFIFEDVIFKVSNDRETYLQIREYDSDGNFIEGHSVNVVERFFKYLEIKNYYEWLTSIYGYEAEAGAFPAWHTVDKHFMANKVLDALKKQYTRITKGYSISGTNLLLLV